MTIKNNQHTEEFYFEEGCYITELWNEKTDKAVSIARARLTPGQTTLKHALDNTVERYLILEGEGQVYLDTQSAQAVSKDDVVYISPSKSQYIRNTGKQDLVFLAICTPRFEQENYQDLSLSENQ